MRLAIKLLAGAALCAMLATLDTAPARAAEHQIGSVNVAAGHYTDVRWSRFGGPLDHITFVPENDAIDCEHVTINYRDGTSHDVFSGYVAAGARTTISLPPPNDGRVADVTFACKARHMDGARVALSAVTDAWPRDWEGERPAHVTTEAHAD
jgi:hypothetical protein